MMLASTGFRAVERLSGAESEIQTSKLHPSKGICKRRIYKDQNKSYIFLTEEVVNQLEQYLEYKYGTRRASYPSIFSNSTSLRNKCRRKNFIPSLMIWLDLPPIRLRGHWLREFPKSRKYVN